jgi:hypothetical protein
MHRSRGLAILEAITRQLLVKTLRAGKDLACDLESVEISSGAIIKCNYEFCVKMVNKANIHFKTPSIVT